MNVEGAPDPREREVFRILTFLLEAGASLPQAINDTAARFRLSTQAVREIDLRGCREHWMAEV